MSSSPKTFLVCHGAWSAGWAWKKMHPLMIKAGHRLVTPTYTGLGERAHLAHPAIDLFEDHCAVDLLTSRKAGLAGPNRALGAYVLDARSGEVDVLLLDLSMPDQGGVDALVAIRARCPELPVLILSGFPEAHYATTLLRQGASGYLNKECEPEEIATAIRTVARGRRHICWTADRMLS